MAHSVWAVKPARLLVWFVGGLVVGLSVGFFCDGLVGWVGRLGMSV